MTLIAILAVIALAWIATPSDTEESKDTHRYNGERIWA